MAKDWAKPFYNTRAWRKQRLYIIRRDKFTCRRCGARAEEVHHVIALTPENIHDARITLSENNLISLCGDCHKKVERRKHGAVPEGYIFDSEGHVVRAEDPPGG